MKKIEKKNIENILALTPMQEGMLFHSLKSPDSNRYFEQLSLVVSGPLNKELFNKAWNFVIGSNDMLRTVFRWQHVKKPIQLILKSHDFQPAYFDLTPTGPARSKSVTEIQREDKQKGFNLEEVAFRVTLCKTDELRYVMMVSNHHILYDGWSTGIILKDFFDAYDKLLNNIPLTSPSRPGYGEFVKWLGSQDTVKQDEFWKTYLTDFTPRKTYDFKQYGLKTGKTKEITQTAVYKRTVPTSLFKKADAFIKARNSSIATLLYSAWGLLLQMYNGTDDVLFDTTVSGRSAKIKGIEKTVGLFINTLPLRIQIRPGEPVADFLAGVDSNLRLWGEFENSSLANLNEYLEKFHHKNLFDSVMVIENYPLDTALLNKRGPLQINSFDASGMTGYDLTVLVTTVENLAIHFTYNSELFDEIALTRLTDRFLTIIQSLTEEGTDVAEITTPVPEEEIRGLISALNSRIEVPVTLRYSPPENGTESKLVDLWSELLRVEKDAVGIDTSFFDFGGHSLKAALLAARIHKEFNVKMPLAAVFEHPTIRGLAAVIEKAGVSRFRPIERAEKKEYYPVSAAQKRMVALHLLAPQSIAYNVSAAIHIKGPMDKKRAAGFEYAFKKLFQRHESLRTSIRLINGEPKQIIHDTVDFTLEYFENTSFIRPFDLSCAPLVRIGLLELEAGHLLLFDAHHIVTDGSSMNIFIGEFMALYGGRELPGLDIQYRDFSNWQAKRAGGRELREQEAWWLERFHGEIEPATLPSDFPRTPERLAGTGGATLYFTIKPGLREKIRDLERQSGATLYMILLAAYNVLLMKYTGREDIVVGTVSDGRTHPDLDAVVGVLIATLAMRNFPARGKSFRDFLEDVKRAGLKAFEYSEYQFEDLLSALKVKRAANRNPLFDTMFILQNYEWTNLSVEGVEFKPYPLEKNASAFELRLTATERRNGSNSRSDDGTQAGSTEIELELQYASSLFKPATIHRLAGHYKTILEAVTAVPSQILGEIDVLTAVERKTILEEFNATDTDVGEPRPVYRLFEDQVLKTPNEPAVIWRGETISYNELNERINRLSCFLSKRGVGAGDVVGVLLPPEAGMVEAVFAVRKAGAAYMPVDPKYPEQRITRILNDSAAGVLLSRREIATKTLTDTPGERLLLLDGIAGELSRECPDNPDYTADLNSLAYVIYTSGSTGKPKGAAVYHRGFFNLIAWFTNEFALNERDGNVLVTSMSFDLTQKNIFAPLVTGGRLYLPGQDYFDPAVILQILEEQQVTWLNCTPSMIYKIIQYCEVPGTEKLAALQGLRYLFLGGEPIAVNMMRSWLESPYFKGELVNTYGPTECTDICAYYRTAAPPDYLSTPIPTGKPVYNTRLYVLDSSQTPIPTGVAGELFIGGAGVGAGYINAVELTLEKFIQSPAALQNPAQDPPAILYRTGDRVMWREDGNIEFLGRMDHQVKIRGFRIELGEIESRLLSHKKIKAGVVRVLERHTGAKTPGIAGENYLCGYFVADESLDIPQLRQFLGQQLPDYMIPLYFIHLEKMPLTPNGKIDWKALPLPKTESADATRTEAISETEKKMLKLWYEVLGTGQIGTTDNFFECGGDSLLAIRLIARIREEFAVELPVRTFFLHSSISELSKEIESHGGRCHRRLSEGPCAGSAKGRLPLEPHLRGHVAGVSSLEPASGGWEKMEYYPLSPAQQRLYVLYQMEKKSTAYNITAVFQLDGLVDISRMETVFTRLIQRHESLRTSFISSESGPVQRVWDTVDFRLEPPMVSQTNEYPIEHANEQACVSEAIERFIRPFDLAKKTLFRVGLLEIPGITGAESNQHYQSSPLPARRAIGGPGETFPWRSPRRGPRRDTGSLLVIDMHHIVTDALSMAVLAGDFVRFYEGEEVVPLRVQYKEYSLWLKRCREAGQFLESEAYWGERFLETPPLLELPLDFHRPAEQSFEGGEVGTFLSVEDTAVLKQLALGEETTLYTLLLAVYFVLLSKMSGMEDIVVGIPVGGRDFTELEPVVGMFVNTLPVRACPGGGEGFGGFLGEVKNAVLGAFEHRDYPYEELVDKVVKERDISRNPLFDTMFTLLPEETATREFAGLKLKRITYKKESSAFDLSVQVIEVDGGLALDFEYCTKLFEEASVRRFSDFYTKLLRELPGSVDTALSQIELISKEERARVLYEFNGEPTAFPAEKSTHSLFEDQAARTPDSVAVAGNGTLALSGEVVQLSYSQLDYESNRLALHLIDKGAGPGTIVALMIERSAELMTAILAIWKAGAAYLPISAELPVERINYMLKDSNARVLLTSHELAQSLSLSPGVNRVFIDELPPNKNTSQKLESPARRASGLPRAASPWPPESHTVPRRRRHNPAYIIYTSGTTGKPKGVVVPHGALVSRLYWLRKRYRLDGRDVVLQKTPYTFDVSVCEMTRWMPVGGRVCFMAPGAEKDPAKITAAVSRFSITLIDFVPSILNLFLDYIDSRGLVEAVSTLRWVFTGVETMERGLVKRFNALLYDRHKTVLLNTYGPTEATVDVTWYDCSRAGKVDLLPVRIPIGAPMDNVSLYILNHYDQLQPVGLVGELCISGESLALGYLNNPEFTAERFRKDSRQLAVGSWQKEKEKEKAIKEQKEIKEKKEQRAKETETVNLSQLARTAPLNKSLWESGTLSSERVLAPGGHTCRWPPEAPVTDGIYYKTGDLARWLPDGNIEFLGRRDFQVKVRGHRVELGEVEDGLMRHTSVGAAVVLPKRFDGGETMLYAFVVPVNDDSRNEETLREFLRGILPEYMVPGAFAFLEALPLTVNEKIDRKTLAEMAVPAPAAGADFVAFRNATEEALVLAWKELLNTGNREIGVTDNFFRLGGHSLSAVRLVSEIHKKFSVEVPLGDIFRYPTPEVLARRIHVLSAGASGGTFSIGPAEKREYFPMSPAQKRLFILEQMEDAGTAYNMPVVMHVRGELEPGRLEPVFKQLIRRHESLRTSFTIIHGTPVQRIRDELDFSVETGLRRGCGEGEEEIASRFIRPFDLSQAPLLRVGLVEMDAVGKNGVEESEMEKNAIEKGPGFLLLVDMHHIISDGMSTGVLIREFSTLYRGEALPPLPLQYKDFSLWQAVYFASGELNRQKEYWLERFSTDEIPVLDLPADFPRPVSQSYDGGGAAFEADAGDSDGLMRLAADRDSSLFMLLTAIYNVFLFKLSGQEDVVVGTPVAGRRHEELEGILGMFVNTLALRNFPVG
ncbi:MAG: amino acid adenylation domain-containing protein, partial [bacterium]|nr:amino acid adenylation domain-containing protein [bacterium]